MRTISVKVDEETRNLLDRLAAARNESKSEVIRKAIAALAAEARVDGDGGVFDRIKHLAGCVAGEGKATSAKIGQQLADDPVRKRRNRRRTAA